MEKSAFLGNVGEAVKWQHQCSVRGFRAGSGARWGGGGGMAVVAVRWQWGGGGGSAVG